jgi:MFS family permease
VQASLAYPIGCLGDSADRKTLVLVGFCVLALADVVLICAATPGGVLAGFCLTGLHMALTHSNMKVRAPSYTCEKSR